MSMLSVAATQMACSWDLPANLERAEKLIREAAANMVPVIASNRIGTEYATQDSTYEITFYGHSFIADHTGEVVAQADDQSEAVLVHEFDMELIRSFRDAWGIYRDRRPDLYQTIATLDGGR